MQAKIFDGHLLAFLRSTRLFSDQELKAAGDLVDLFPISGIPRDCVEALFDKHHRQQKW